MFRLDELERRNFVVYESSSTPLFTTHTTTAAACQVGDFGLATVRAASSSSRRHATEQLADAVSAHIAVGGADSSSGAGDGGGGASSSRSGSRRLGDRSLEHGGGSESITGGIGTFMACLCWRPQELGVSVGGWTQPPHPHNKTHR